MHKRMVGQKQGTDYPNQSKLSQKFPAANEALGNSSRREPHTKSGQVSCRETPLKVIDLAAGEANDTVLTRVSTGITP